MVFFLRCRHISGRMILLCMLCCSVLIILYGLGGHVLRVEKASISFSLFFLRFRKVGVVIWCALAILLSFWAVF
jgi:hypothetical protein